MRSPSGKGAALLRLEAGELAASRSAWLYLLAMGPLAGHAFTTAVSAYAEASGAGGGPAALAQGLSPLDGILVPTFGANDVALTLLFPFVAIRLISEEKRTGAARIAAQTRAGLGARLGAKLVAATGLWALGIVAPLLGVVLWRLYGGHVGRAELACLAVGHVLRFLLATSIAFAAASITEGAASAAIVTLAFTVGTWALDFVGNGRGGMLGAAARFTPGAALRTLERGELSWPTAGVLVAVSLGALAFAAEWLTQWRPARSRALRSAGIAAATALAAVLASRLPAGPDLSEDRRNSFSRGDEAALARIEEAVTITVRLAPEDPRLFDLERGVLAKLRRSLPHLSIRYAADESSGSTGLFATPGTGYGEIEYRVGSRTATSRSTTPRIVLDEIYRLAGVAAATAGGAETEYPGYPLQARPVGAGWIFYGGWPLAAGLAFLVERRGRWRSRCETPSASP